MSGRSRNAKPSTWARTELSEVTEERIDQPGPEGDGTFTYLDIGGIDNKSKRIIEPKTLPVSQAPSRAKQLVKAGDVLVSMTRPNLNAVALVPPELDNSIASTGFHVLRAREAAPAWLYYAVQTPDFVDAMCQLVQGALYPAVRPKDIRAFALPMPPLPEQHRIVAEIEKQFTRLDAGVAALRRAQANLKRYRASVLKAACEGKLVPTEVELARAEGREYESGTVLLERILVERRASWAGRGKYKEPAAPDVAGLPELPEGWCWAGTEEVSAAIDNAMTIGPFGSSLMVKDYQPTGVPLVFVREIRSATFMHARTRYVTIDKAATLSAHRVQSGDVLITKMGEPPGDTAIYPVGLPDAVATSDCIKLTPNTKATTPQFLKYVIRTQIVKAQIGKITSGVAQKKVSLARFRRIAIPLAPFLEQQRIVAEVERRLSVIDELEAVVSANLLRAARLRQAVLRRAFLGEL